GWQRRRLPRVGLVSSGDGRHDLRGQRIQHPRRYRVTSRSTTRSAERSRSHAKAGKHARLVQGAERRTLVADRRGGAVTGIHLRVRREGHYALEAPLHLVAIPTGKIPPAGGSSEYEIAREEHVLAREKIG